MEQMLQAFQSQQLEAANKYAGMILKLNSKDLVALQVQGLSLAMQGRVRESVEPLYKASKLDPNNSELLSNLAKAQYGADMYSEATQTYKKLDRLLPNNAQILTDMGTALAKLKLYEEARKCFDRSIEIQPSYFLTWSNLGNLLAELRFSGEAIQYYQKALELNPSYAEGWTNYGNALFALGRYTDAKLAHEKALQIDRNFGVAWSNYGNALLELKLEDAAFDAYQKAFSINPDIPYLMGQCFTANANRCIWTNNPSENKLLESVSSGKLATIPFNLLHTDADLRLQKLCATNFSHDRFPKLSFSSQQGSKRRVLGKVRIGYFSSDFREHPVGMLIENILRYHNRDKFEIIGFFLNLSSGDSIEQKLRKSFDSVINLYGLSDIDAVKIITNQNLDLAIDLNGHTSGARTALFAHKIAPIQVNYLGYAGTSGANFYDVLIADEVVIPCEHIAYYSEPISYLPNSFFPADTSISIESIGSRPTRVNENLPVIGFIFACFNNIYKITPYVFDIWMDLLKNVPGSILWLSKPNPTAIANLHIEAQKRGVDPSRLIFADRKADRSEHLSRLRLADLFLDTPNYNAHATAADALWAGVPVLTLIGKTFAGRVAASQLSALGLTELITHSDGEYFAKALDLATSPDKLMLIRTRMHEGRANSPLFNTKKYVADLESLYTNLLDGVNQH